MSSFEKPGSGSAAEIFPEFAKASLLAGKMSSSCSTIVNTKWTAVVKTKVKDTKYQFFSVLYVLYVIFATLRLYEDEIPCKDGWQVTQAIVPTFTRMSFGNSAVDFT